MTVLNAPKVLAVAFGTAKTLVWETSESMARCMIASLRRGVSWNDARQPLGDDYVATNSVSPDICAQAERLAQDCDYFIDLDNLQESLAEIN